MEATDDGLIAAYLIDPGRAEYLLDDLAENGFELEPDPPTEDETATLVRHAEASLRLAPLLREKVRERGIERLYDEIGSRSRLCSRRWRTPECGSIRTAWGDTARLSDRVEELEARAYRLAGEEFVIGSPIQLGRILFEKLELTPDARARPATRPTARCSARSAPIHEIVPIVEVARVDDW